MTRPNLDHLLRTFQYLDDTDPSKARIQETMERGRTLADALLDAAKNQHLPMGMAESISFALRRR